MEPYGEGAVAQFEADSLELWTVRHPNVIWMYGVHHNGSSEFLILTAFADLGSLSDHITRSVPEKQLKGWPELLEIARQAAQGLSYLHGRDIVHGDVKASNVCIGANYKAMVADYGMSDLKARCRGPNFMRVAALMAPELHGGAPSSKEADVYAFGVVLWQMYMHREPYQDVKKEEIAVGIHLGTMRLSLPSHCPGEYSALVDMCTSHDPARRPTFEGIVSHLTRIKKSPARGSPGM